MLHFLEGLKAWPVKIFKIISFFKLYSERDVTILMDSFSLPKVARFNVMYSETFQGLILGLSIDTGGPRPNFAILRVRNRLRLSESDWR